MRFVILGLLLAGPLSLYDLHKRFSAGVSLFYSASFGSLQRALRHLIDDGSVTVSGAAVGARERKLHTVTDVGRVKWRAWMRSPLDDSDPETTMLAKVFLLARLPEAEDRQTALHGIRIRAATDLAALRTLAAEADARRPEIHPSGRAEFAAQRATLDYGIRSHELALTWVEELIANEGIHREL